jgi:hypothetical protein
MAIKENIDIVTEVVLKEANVSLRSDGIVYVFFKEHALLDINLQLRMFEAYHTVTNSKLTPFLFIADSGVTITKEARDNAILLEESSPCKATAVIVTNLAYKLIANFYMQFNKPKRPYKVFSNKGDAIEWLKIFL